MAHPVTPPGWYRPRPPRRGVRGVDGEVIPNLRHADQIRESSVVWCLGRATRPGGGLPLGRWWLLTWQWP